MGDAFFDGDPLPRVTTNPESEVAAAYRAALDVPRVGDVAEVELTRDSVVGIDWADYHQWTIGNVPAGSFPLFGFYRIINNSTVTPTAGDHSVSMIAIGEDSTGGKLNMIAGESRVNARGVGIYAGHNSKLTYRQHASQLPAANGLSSAAHWSDVLFTQSDGVTPLTTAGLYATVYLADPVVGGDPLLRASFRGYDRIITSSATNATATDAAIHAPYGGITCAGNSYVGGSVTAVGNITSSETVSGTKSVNDLYAGVSSNNVNVGSAAAACAVLASNAGSTYMGKGSTAFATVPGTASKYFVYDTVGIVLTGSATKVDSLVSSGKITTVSVVPPSFADLAAVRTWLAANFT
jgi:hypothetical protein